VVSAIFLTPLALLFRGANAVIDPRTIYPVYVAETTVLEGDFIGVPDGTSSQVSSLSSSSSGGNSEISSMLENYRQKKEERKRKN